MKHTDAIKQIEELFRRVERIDGWKDSIRQRIEIMQMEDPRTVPNRAKVNGLLLALGMFDREVGL